MNTQRSLQAPVASRPLGCTRLGLLPSTSYSRPASVLRGSALRVRASSSDEFLDEIDPFTGMPIAKAAVTAPTAGSSVKAGSYTWTYRRTQPEPSKASSSKPAVLLMHGLGSSSYCWRNTMGLLGGEGYDALAPDWLGHGGSDKPSSGFDYSEAAYVRELGNFVAASGVKQPYALVVQGYVLGQYALLYALQNPDQVDRLMILNTPLALNSKLRPDLAAYKNPITFMRPGNKPFDGGMYNIQGSAYEMQEKDYKAYAEPYKESPAASQAVAQTMEKLDFSKLLKKVDDGFVTWRKPSVLLFGSADPFIDAGAPFAFLDSKRTNMKAMSPSAKLGHMPQEDYPEAIHEQMLDFLAGSTDAWEFQPTSLKMTKKGAVAA